MFCIFFFSFVVVEVILHESIYGFVHVYTCIKCIGKLLCRYHNFLANLELSLSITRFAIIFFACQNNKLVYKILWDNPRSGEQGLSRVHLL